MISAFARHRSRPVTAYGEPLSKNCRIKWRLRNFNRRLSVARCQTFEQNDLFTFVIDVEFAAPRPPLSRAEFRPVQGAPRNYSIDFNKF
jgi:hypothetical protein